MITKISTRLVRHAYKRLPILGNGGFDIGELIKLKAAMDTADYCMEHLPRVPIFPSNLDLLSYALEQVSVAGLYLEFGVASGFTINHIASRTTSKVHGFDSFEGLPEDWNNRFQKGHFAQPIPAVRENVELHTGLFSKTLAGFVKENRQPVAFLHVDCDLYSSTKEVFTGLGGLIVPGTVIVFDEYFNHSTWRQDEWQAFQEFVRDRVLRYKYIGYVPSHQQAAVVIG
jgi:Methyltransferase domain